MRYKVYIIGLVLYCFCNTTMSETRPKNGMVQEKETLDIQYSPELHYLITNWIEEYQSLKPALNINVKESMGFINPEDTYLSFISSESDNTYALNASWKIVVGHDAIVPVINVKNPLIEEIERKGITANKLASLFTGSEDMDWATLLDEVQSQPLHFYMVDDESIRTGIAKFMRSDFDQIEGVNLVSSKELIAAIEKDQFAIGFCRLKDVRKEKGNDWIENIRIAPVDKNANTRIDNFENIYQNPNDFARGVWIGKYPSVLSGNIYALSADQPVDENVIQFLTWILSEGGESLSNYGYSELASVEKQENIDLLNQNTSVLLQSDFKKVSNNWIFIFVGLMVAAVLVIYLVVKMSIARSASRSGYIHMTPGLNENIIVAPKGLYFDKTHTWSYMEKDGLVRIGIDDFLKHLTGDITRVMMKKTGDIVQKGEKIITISHLGKQLTLYSPITGTIQQQNQQLLSNSKLINTSPYAEGWIYLIEPLNWLREIQFMFMADTYKEWLKTEFMRLKNFLTFTVRSNTSAYQHIILQDGGELHDYILADLEPEIWEEFQSKFIDTSK